MANEIQVTAGLRLNNSPLTMSKNVSFSDNQTTKKGPNPGTINVSTTTTTVAFGNLTNPGWAVMQNIGTNPVEIIVSKIILDGSQACVVQLADSATVTINTTTGTSSLQVECIDK
jgi:hypothetical protein